MNDSGLLCIGISAVFSSVKTKNAFSPKVLATKQKINELFKSVKIPWRFQQLVSMPKKLLLEVG
jgi:hypothetical protein